MASIDSILMDMGDIAARRRLMSGQVAAQTVAGLSRIPGQIIADRDAARAMAEQRRMEQDAIARDMAYKAATLGQGQQRIDLDAARFEAERGDKAEQAATTARNEQRARQSVLGWLKQHGSTLPQGAAERIQAVMDMPGGLKVVMENLAKAPDPPKFEQVDPEKDLYQGGKLIRPGVRVEKPDTRALNVQLADAIKKGDLAAANAIRRAMRDDAAASHGPERLSFEQQIAEALRRGDQATVDRLTRAAELSAGARARTTGRPVTSGDAGRVSELDTSLDDLAVLRQTVLPVDPKSGKVQEFGTTGTAAKVGAMLPNAVTEFTGWGSDAKSRQAVIDRVKQVIGKALEGGVLRKEDEYKYEKILPTIGDPAPVVETKLNGLEQAIALRRDRQIDALEDAGYDVNKFRERGATRSTGRKVGRFNVEVED